MGDVEVIDRDFASTISQLDNPDVSATTKTSFSPVENRVISESTGHLLGTSNQVLDTTAAQSFNMAMPPPLDTNVARTTMQWSPTRNHHALTSPTAASISLPPSPFSLTGMANAGSMLNGSDAMMGQSIPQAQLAMAQQAALAAQTNASYSSSFDDYEYQASLLSERTSAQGPSAFAKLQFEDGDFFMSTYQVKLGRDQVAYLRIKKGIRKRQLDRARQGASRSGHQTPSGTMAEPIVFPGEDDDDLGDHEIRAIDEAAAIESVQSAHGGVCTVEDHDPYAAPPRPRSSRKQHSSRSSSHGGRRRGEDGIGGDNPQSHTPVNEPSWNRIVAPDNERPPYGCPLIPIHPPLRHGGAGPLLAGYKRISKEHIKIAYNNDTWNFDMTVLGSNGCFHDNEHFSAGSIVPLHHGSELQIADIVFRFLLPETRTGDEEMYDDLPEADSAIASTEQDYYDPYLSAHLQDGKVKIPASDEEASDGDDADSAADPSEDEDARPGRGIRLKLKVGSDKKTKVPGRRGRKPREPESSEEEEQPAPRRGRKPRRASTSSPEREPAKRGRKPKRRESSSEEPVESKKKTADKEPKTPADGQPKSATATTEPPAPIIGPDGEIIRPKRKGPGRPPKDGIMSKRERQMIERQKREAEKAKAQGLPPPPMEDYKTMTAKKKAEKKAAEQNEAQAEATTAPEAAKSINGDEPSSPTHARKGSTTAPPTTPVVPVKRRSESPELPVMRREDYSEEQLARPQESYVTMIRMVLQESRTGTMNLQNIYVAIERKWPFFKFGVTTNGWQSSVRHNLLQRPDFCKVEKEGKGFVWGISPDAPPDNPGQRRRRTPPPPSATPSQQPPHYPPSMPMPSAYPPSYPYAPNSYAPSSSAQGGNYASPYASRPPPPPSYHPPLRGPQAQHPPQQHSKGLPPLTDSAYARLPPLYGPIDQNSAAAAPLARVPVDIPATVEPQVRLIIGFFRKVFLCQSSGDLRAWMQTVDFAIRRVCGSTDPRYADVASRRLGEQEGGVVKALEELMAQRLVRDTVATHEAGKTPPGNNTPANTTPNTAAATPDKLPAQVPPEAKAVAEKVATAVAAPPAAGSAPISALSNGSILTTANTANPPLASAMQRTESTGSGLAVPPVAAPTASASPSAPATTTVEGKDEVSITKRAREDGATEEVEGEAEAKRVKVDE